MKRTGDNHGASTRLRFAILAHWLINPFRRLGSRLLVHQSVSVSPSRLLAHQSYPFRRLGSLLLAHQSVYVSPSWLVNPLRHLDSSIWFAILACQSVSPSILSRLAHPFCLGWVSDRPSISSRLVHPFRLILSAPSCPQSISYLLVHLFILAARPSFSS